MTIHSKPRDVLTAFKPKLLPPKRMTDADSLLLEIRDRIAKAQNMPELLRAARNIARRLPPRNPAREDQPHASRHGRHARSELRVRLITLAS